MKQVFVLLFFVSSFFSAQAQMCPLMLGNTSGITSTIDADPNLSATLNLIKNKLTTDDQLDSPVKISKKMQKFRNQYLPYFKISRKVREGLVRWMEAELRMESYKARKQLLNAEDKPEYDLVIVGAGVHGITALHEALRVNPKLKVLIVESTDTGASNFRYAGDSFSLNSSTRASGKKSKPLPGKGNINELPRNPIQVSDISANKYPTANDLGSALIAGLYAEVSAFSNVDIVFNAEADSPKTKSGKFATELKVRLSSPNKKKESVKVKSQKIFFASGPGASRLPRGVEQNIEKYPELVEVKQSLKELPKVLTYFDLLKILAQDPNPGRFFKGKRIGLAGKGDSANTILEFLLGYSTPGAYGFSDAQTSGAERILWFGQSQKTCEDFIAQARSRYAQIGTGFRSSDPSKKPILKGKSSRVKSVKPQDKDIRVLTEDDKYEYVDHLILATGIENQLYEVLKSLVSDSRADRVNNSKDFLDSYFKFIEGKTSVSKGKKVRIARTLDKKRTVSVIGTAAEGLPRQEELLGIIQNSVSIFNNAPRVVSATKKLVEDLDPKAKRTKASSSEKRIGQSIEIKDLSPIRSLDSVNDIYLKETARGAFRRAGASDKAEFEILNSDRGLVIQNINLSEREFSSVVQSLVSTRDFFNTVKLLLSTPNTTRLTATYKRGKVRFDYDDRRRSPRVDTSLKNPSIAFERLEVK